MLAHDPLHRLFLLAVVVVWLADTVVLAFLAISVGVSVVVLVVPTVVVEWVVLAYHIEEVVVEVPCIHLNL